MRVSLKGFKSLRGREGLAYGATILVDGKPVGTVDQYGDGSEARYHFFYTPNGKNVAGFTDSHAALMKENRKKFVAALSEDAIVLNGQIINKDEEFGEWDSCMEEIVANLTFIKHAVANAKTGYPVTLVTCPVFSERDSDMFKCVSYEQGGMQHSSGVNTAAQVAEVFAEHPGRRILAFSGAARELVGVVREGTGETAWLTAVGRPLPDTAPTIAWVAGQQRLFRFARQLPGVSRQAL